MNKLQKENKVTYTKIKNLISRNKWITTYQINPYPGASSRTIYRKSEKSNKVIRQALTSLYIRCDSEKVKLLFKIDRENCIVETDKLSFIPDGFNDCLD